LFSTINIQPSTIIMSSENTEVLMHRSTRRISRALIVGLGATLALGLVFWLGNLSGSSRARQEENGRVSKAAPTTQPLRVAIGDATALPTTATPIAAKQPTAKTPPVLAGVTEISVGPSTRPAPSAGNVQVASLNTPSKTAPAAPTGSPVLDAKALADSGKLLQARTMLNAALTGGKLSELDTSAAKAMLNQINATVVFSGQKFPDDDYGGSFNVPSGGVLAKIAATHEVTAELLMRINGIKVANKLQAGRDIKVLKGPFHAAVYKKAFRIELWQGEPDAKGSMYVTSFPVGLGKEDSTPSGVWMVKVGGKLTNPAYYSPRGEGIIEADDPKNPLGDYWIGLVGTDGHAVGKQSYGIHGTIDPTSVGKQESMGCIRMKNEDVAQVYEMLVDGKSTVTVKD
jgi:LysM repeat protein